jgi:hypothetical protein
MSEPPERRVMLRRPPTPEEFELYMQPLMEDALDRLGVKPGELFRIADPAAGGEIFAVIRRGGPGVEWEILEVWPPD